MSEIILEVKKLNTYYDDEGTPFHKGKKRQVCKDISFQMKAGEVLGLVGESGSGKTTLVKTILGMVKEYEGEVICNAIRPQMIFQDPYSSLNPSKKIGWLLQEPLRIKGGFSKAEREEKAYAMLEKVGLSSNLFHYYPKELSGGQRQRAAIGIALMLDPKLLIADEPVSALDVTIQAQIMELLLKLKKEMGLSILFISHDLRVVYKMCDRVLIMEGGTIVEQGNIKEIYQNPKHTYTKMLLDAILY